MSSASMPAKSRSFAYQREAQLRLTERRKPVDGFLSHLVLVLVHYCRPSRTHVAAGLRICCHWALGARGEAAQRGALLDVDGLTRSSSISAPSLCFGAMTPTRIT